VSELERLEQAAAACLFPAFPGTTAPDWILRWIEHGIGGVVLFAGNVESPGQVAPFTQALRSERADLLVAIDEEGGDVTRLEAQTGSSYPGNWALGVVDDVRLTEEIAASIASELASVGINFDFAPVADVNVRPDNPVIGIRAFGTEPTLVSRHVAAFVTGLQRQRVAACAKHFPGHGDTSEDSHLELPVVHGDVRPALEPFRAAIAADVRAIMTAHVIAPALSDEQATLSREVLTELLRDELGFEGVAITDALEMRAVSETVGVEAGAVRALAAGADALCLGAEIDDGFVARVHSAVVGAVRAGELAEDRLQEAADRVRELAEWSRAPSAGAVRRELGTEAAARALRVEGKGRLSAPPLVVELRPPASIAAGEPQHGLGDLLQADSVALAEGEPLPEPSGRPVVVVVRDAHRHEWQRDAVERLTPSVVVETGVPLWRPDGVPWIATYGNGRANLEAAAAALAPLADDEHQARRLRVDVA
jgi:beta-N-acetylhexosaminidase